LELEKLLLSFLPYTIVTIVLLNQYESRIIYSGGAMDFRRMHKAFEVIRLEKERDESYTILVKEL